MIYKSKIILFIFLFSYLVAESANTENAKLTLGEYIENINGVNLYYEIAGNFDGPIVLIAHGNPGMNSYMYKKLIGKELEEEMTIIYLDQRGMGRSDLLDKDTPISIEIIADDFEALRRKLGIKKWILFGHSAGMFYCLQYAGKYLDHVQGLILVDGGYKGPSLWYSLKTILGMKIERRLFYDSEGNNSEDFWKIIYKEGPPFVKGVMSRMTMDFFWFNSSKYHKKINVPTLIITGKYSKLYEFKEQCIKLSKRIKGSELYVFEKSGHFPFYEEKDKFLEVVLSFSDRHFGK